jgi:hypothetical protein
MTTTGTTGSLTFDKIRDADRLAAARRLRDRVVRRLAHRTDLTDQQRERAFALLVSTIELIREWDPPMPAEREAHALVALERQGP